MADYFTIITIKMAYCNQLLSVAKAGLERNPLPVRKTGSGTNSCEMHVKDSIDSAQFAEREKNTPDMADDHITGQSSLGPAVV